MFLFLALACLSTAPTAAQPLIHTWESPEPEQYGYFGRAVAGVSDTDGDGRGDVLVGGSREDVGALSSAGRAYLLSGATGDTLRTLRSPAPEGYGRFGEALAGVRDLDGDGRGDLLIGAPGERRAYLFSGATGTLLRTLESPSLAGGSGFGEAVSGVPDADGDGGDDLLVGASGEDGGDFGAGRAYLFSGTTGAHLATLESANPQVSGKFGFAVSGVPDADGDGRGDLLVGAWFEEVGGDHEAGRAYLFSGASGAHLHTLESPNFEGRGDFGRSVVGVPDADGDGRGDLLVGAWGEDVGGLFGAGRAYLFSGMTGDTLRTLTAPTPEASSRFGFPVSAVSDADGTADYLIGAHGAEVDGEIDSGRVYLLSGATGVSLFSLTSPNAERSGFFGRAVAGVPDADGDGRGDLLVGAWGEDVGDLSSAGRAYLFSGAPPLVDLHALATSPTTVMPGGTVSFDYTLLNTTASPIAGALRAGVRDAHGDPLFMFGPVVRGTLHGGETYAGTLVQPVPAEASPGTYTYALAAVTRTGEVLDEDTFTITVAPGRGGTSPAVPWAAPRLGERAIPLPGGEAARTIDPAAAVSPNPFRSHTTLRFRLDEASAIRLTVYDLLGRDVGVWVNGRYPAGTHAVRIDGTRLPPGTYLWRLVREGRTETGQLTRLR